MSVELAPDFYYTAYETLLIQAYDSTKRPVQLTVSQAVQLALKTVTEERHGELVEERLYEIHRQVRRRFGIEPY